MRYELAGSQAVERLGDELLICDADGQTLHRLSGVGRTRFEQVIDAGVVELPDDEVTVALETAGLIVPVGVPALPDEATISRRRALAVGAAAAAAGVVTIALPKAAAAESPGPTPTSEAPPPAPGPSGALATVAIQSETGNLRIVWEPGLYGPFTYDYTVTGAISDSGTLSASETFTTVGVVPLNGTVNVTLVSNTVPSTTVTQTLTRTS